MAVGRFSRHLGIFLPIAMGTFEGGRFAPYRIPATGQAILAATVRADPGSVAPGRIPEPTGLTKGGIACLCRRVLMCFHREYLQ